jgi:hypothetical protein
MNKDVHISIFEVVGSPLCVASGDGELVYERVKTALGQGKAVSLSFHNVSTLTSAFLNAAIGQLYGQFSEHEIRKLVSVEDMAPDDLALLKRVVDTAKEYFKDPVKFDAAVREALEEGDDGE